MKKILFILSSAALVFTACQKEENVADNGEGMFLTATVEQQMEGTETKSSLDGTSVMWTAGDAIKLFDNDGNGAQLVATGDGTSTGFKEPTKQVRDDDFDESDLSCAIYPYSAATSCDGTNITFTLPATQTYAKDSFGPGANVAVGTFSSKKVEFKNVCGVFKLTIYGNYTVSKIELSGKNNEKLNGSYSVAASTYTCTCATTETTSEKTITLDCSKETDGGVTLSPTTATTFYFVVPVGAFSKGFTAYVYEKGQEEATYKYTELSSTTADKNTISRSLVKAMPESTILPPAYQKVEYIKGTGVQYIDTGIKGTGKMRISLRASSSNVSSNTALFGCCNHNNWQAGEIAAFYFSGTYDVPYPTSNDVSVGLHLKSVYVSADVTYDYVYDSTGFYIDGVAVSSFPNTSPQAFYTDYVCTRTLSLPGVHRTSVCSVAPLSIYYFVVEDNNGYVGYFIPCSRKSDSKPGMYDLVSRNFFVNQGTGDDFTIGSAVTH